MNTEITDPEDVKISIISDEDTAEAIITGLTDMIENAYAIISFVHSSFDARGNSLINRKNFSFIKTEAGAFEHSTDSPDFLTMNEFSSYLGSSLRPGEDESSVLVLAVFDFDNLNIPEGSAELAKPEEVFQWVVRSGTIIPDDYCDSEWNGVKVQAGPEFVLEGADEYLGYAGEAEDFELPDTSMAVEFMQNLLHKAPDGNHVITVVLSDIVEGYNTSDLTFHKAGDKVVFDQTRGAMTVIDISSTVAAGEHAGVTLRSYIDRSEEDGFQAGEDRQEVRGWHLSLAGIHALSADECSEAYCIDEETGEPTLSEDYVSYCNGWL